MKLITWRIKMPKVAQTGMDELREIVKELAKSQKKTDQGFREVQEAQKKTEKSQQKTDQGFREVQEAQKKTEESLQRLEKSLNKANGEFNNKWGEFMEKLIHGDLIKLLRERGIQINSVIPRLTLESDKRQKIAEYDLVAPNGDEVVVIEVKTTLLMEDVKKFIEKIKKFKHHFPAYKDHKVYGGMAHLGIGKEEKEDSAEYAASEGLFVLQAPAGAMDVTTITNSKDFTPKEF